MPISQPCRALSWACRYEGTEVEEVQAMPGKDTRTEAYKMKNPIAAVPRLEEGEFVLNESHAIMCYLGDRHNWKLYPSDPQVRAKIHQYMNWHHQYARKITMGLFAPIMRPDLKMSEQSVKEALATVVVTLRALEQWLASSPWLCGEVATLADLSCYCEVGQCLDKFTGLFSIAGISLTAFPRVQLWLNHCETLKGFEESHAALATMGPKIKAKAQKSFTSKL